MLNPQLLTTFSAIVSAGSISAAAVRLGCGSWPGWRPSWARA